MEGAEPFRRGGMKSRRSRSFSGSLGGYLAIYQQPRSRLGEAEYQERQESEEEEESEETEVEASLADAPEASETQNLALSNPPLVYQVDGAVCPRDNSRATAIKAPSMKAHDSFDGTKAHKLRVFIQSYQLIFHNYPENFFSDRNKVLFSLVDLENRLNHISQISPMKTHPTSSITGSCFKPSFSLFLVIPMKSGKLKKSLIISV
ncbi:hypothetical protein O181_030641 [Austropuccinia psidii MF-1]|uniref:Uncharacterized protein n=1 Tax=Austropuccinia psidii MF-1 TaxID=1389203 RepID=A0A9Q3CYW0_9BASI|nr:hypothetical protein [Austropuccinia psidii MF-1]